MLLCQLRIRRRSYITGRNEPLYLLTLTLLDERLDPEKKPGSKTRTWLNAVLAIETMLRGCPTLGIEPQRTTTQCINHR